MKSSVRVIITLLPLQLNRCEVALTSDLLPLQSIRQLSYKV